MNDEKAGSIPAGFYTAADVRVKQPTYLSIVLPRARKEFRGVRQPETDPPVIQRN